MADPIITAGRAQLQAESPQDTRRAALKLVREALRKPDATDDEYEAALEALVELSKD